MMGARFDLARQSEVAGNPAALARLDAHLDTLNL
jgi:hypothetical protein